MNACDNSATIITTILAGVILCVCGCPAPQTKPPTENQVAEAVAWSEMHDIKSRIRKELEMPIDPENLSLDQQSLDQKVEQIERLTDPEARNTQLSELVRQLLYEKRLNEASKLVVKITDITERDRLLEGIVRFHLQDAYRLYDGGVPLLPNERIPESVLLPVHRAAEAAKNIYDPLNFVETIGSIALFRGKIKDSGLKDMMDEAVKSFLSRPASGLRNARAAMLLADWFVRNNDTEPLKPLAAVAERVLDEASADYDTASLFMEIVAIYFLLNDTGSVERTSRHAERIAEKIIDPRQKVLILLRLAEAQLLMTGKDTAKTLPKRIVKIKGFASTVDELVRDPAFPSGEVETPDLPSGREAIAMKNRVLRKVVAIQAWKAPLEDVWDTIEEMDHGPDRDAALALTIDMMLATQSTEYVRDWAEEISDPERKRTVLQKLSNQ